MAQLVDSGALTLDDIREAEKALLVRGQEEQAQ